MNELKISPIYFEDYQGQLAYKPLALKAIDQAKTMSFSLSQKEYEHIINKLACSAAKLQVAGGLPNDDHQALVDLVPLVLNKLIDDYFYQRPNVLVHQLIDWGSVLDNNGSKLSSKIDFVCAVFAIIDF